MRVEYEQFISKVKEANHVQIYGAGKLARTIYYLLCRKGIEVEGFVVEDINQNPSEFCGRPVIGLDEFIKQEDCSLVAGMERRDSTHKVLSLLLDKKAKNIIMVHFDAVNDIYCNFVLDEDTMESFCEGLKKEKRLIAYVNDSEGNMVVQYLRTRGVKVEEKISSFEELVNERRDSAIILTMGDSFRQRGYITRLREIGFERIILISKEIKDEIESDYKRIVWEEGGAQFQLIATSNIEVGHYMVQRTDKSGLYRWRMAVWDGYPYKDEVIDFIRGDRLFIEYKKQFSESLFLPYNEVPLCEVDKPDICIEVYMASFHRDKKIEPPQLPDWVIPIQVGKALTDIKIADVCDDTGDNISLKNTDYSEGTALYWIWKNTDGQDYVGLFHYRRQMAMGKDSLYQLAQYDVLLTVPTYTPRAIKTFFCANFITLEYDWKLMLQYIREYDEAYYDTALQYIDAHCYFPCNIFIMRRKYFDEMCAFIFGVLEKVDGYYEDINMVRRDRYLGYFVENLLSVYMMHNACRLKIGYTDMKYYYPVEEKILG